MLAWEVSASKGATAYRTLGLTVSVHTQMHGTSLPIVGTVPMAGLRWLDGYELHAVPSVSSDASKLEHLYGKG